MDNNERQGTTAEYIQDERQKRREERAKRRKRERMIATIIRIGMIVLVLALVVGTVWFFAFRDKDGGYSEYDAKLDKLAYKKQQLLAERDKLGADMEKRLGNTSYMSFIFTSLDSALYTSALPVMTEGSTDLVGILGLSPTELPELEGKITQTQYEALMNYHEWGTALYYNGEGTLEDFITTMQTLLDEHKIDFPETIIFKNGCYRDEYDEIILEYGLENALHNGETGIPLIEDTQPSGVWHPGVVGWKAGMSATYLKRNVEAEGGYALLEINFITSTENSACSYFEIEGEAENTRLDSFRKMINLFKSSVNSKDIEVLTTEEVRARREKYYSELTVIEIEYAERRKEINAQIAEIERQMTELYHEYHKGEE